MKISYYKLLLLVLLIIGCNLLKEKDVYGCTDSTACNFNINANISDGCEYIVDECGICGGNSSGICSPNDKAPLNTRELCESADGVWTLNCN